VSEAFRVAWTRTGGFAGIARTVTVDAADLEPGERAAIAALLDDLADGPPPPRGADRFTHELAVERGGATRRFTVHDGAVPPAAADLLARLRARAERAGDAG
jgi:hypothetical protein